MEWQELRERAQTRGVTLAPVEAHLAADLEKAFAVAASQRAEAVLSFSDTLTYIFAGRVAELAFVNKLPLMSPFRETTNAGGLISYGPDIPDLVARFNQIDGYRCLSLMRALAVVKCQSAL